MAREKEIGQWEGLIIIGFLGGIALLAASYFQFSSNWTDATFSTTVIFTGIFLLLRPAWSKLVFWRDLFAILAVHLALLAVIVPALTARTIKVGGWPRTVIGIVEGIFILAVLWPRHISSKTYFQ